MRPIHKPGPKSKTQRVLSKAKPQSDLGDTDTNPSDEDPDTSFRSPPRDENVTDYGLDLTNSPRRTLKPSRPCDPAAATTTRRTSGRPSTSRLARAQEETPVASTSSRIPPLKAKKSRKQKFPARKELRMLLNRTDFMIPRACFARLVREIMMSFNSVVDRITADALEALQVATEHYIENRLADAYLLTLHSRRKTLIVRDLALVNYLLDKCNL